MANRGKSMKDFVPFEYVMLETYRELGLSENELAVLLMSDHLLQQGTPILSSDTLALKMSLKSEEIDTLLASLLSRKFLSYERQGGMSTLSAAPAKERAYARFELAVSKRDGTSVSEERVEKLIAFYEDRLERVLSPLERSSLSRFVDMGFLDGEIEDALLDCLSEHRASLKAVERRLLARRQADDIQKEGATAVSHLDATPIEASLERETGRGK